MIYKNAVNGLVAVSGTTTVVSSHSAWYVSLFTTDPSLPKYWLLYISQVWTHCFLYSDSQTTPPFLPN